MRLQRPQCSHCIYWAADQTANPPTAGHCHRFPPGIHVNPKTGIVVQKFPTTDQHHWCGEWNGDESWLIDSVRKIASGEAP